MNILRAAVLVVAAVLCSHASAQNWPARPVTIVLGYPAGSGIDVVTRFLADSLRERTGVPFVVDNKPGSFANIGALFLDATAAVPHMRAGKIRALAVTNANRVSAAPEVPTIAEAGLAGYELESWFAIFFPAKASRDIAQKIADLSNAAMTSDKGRAFLTKLGADPYPGSPERLAKLVERDLAKWGKIIKNAGIEPE